MNFESMTREELIDEIKCLETEKDDLEDECGDLERHINNLQDEMLDLESEISKLQLIHNPDLTEWSLDFSNDGTPILTANGKECPHHLVMEIVNNILVKQ